ncbi:glycosyltransferase [Bradyrhizobium sp. 200]|uniref:glycosyltransferase n=1 Tax=Bradyrhizobium sp. 200 TaxID=2782665 RepID=UPI001FFF60AF|nr:glycosyltransferase [Bradyrhizobium sp. 200]
MPRALCCHQALGLLITDAWVRPGNPLGLLSAGLKARFHAELAEAEVYGPAVRSMAFELRARRSVQAGWPLVMARNRWFQQVALARLSQVVAGERAPVLMGYSYAAAELFAFARRKGWRTVLGQIDPGPVEEEIVAGLQAAAPRTGGDWTRAPAAYWSEWRRECALADRIVVNSSWSRDALLQEGVPADKIRIVPLAYERPPESLAFRRRYPSAFSRTRPLRVLFLGQVNLRKGVEPLLAAIRLLSDEPIEFTFVGPVQIAIPADLRNNRQVLWRGPAPRPATGQFYNDADVFLFPTFSDGFGLTQLEAQAWRLPIITTRFCGEVVEHGRNGWILPEITPQSIAEMLRECLRDPVRLQAASDLSGVDEKFGLVEVGREWMKVFD